MRSLIVLLMDSCCRCSVVDGARMSISRWKSSHQKGAVLLLVGQLV